MSARRRDVEAYKEIAGDGTVDERCARIVGYWRTYGAPWDRSGTWYGRLEARRERARRRMAA